MEEVLLTDRPDLAIAEKAGQPHGSKLALDSLGVMVRRAKKVLAASIATAQAAAVDGRAMELFLGGQEQFVHVFARPRHRAHGQHAGLGIAPEQVADKKIPPMILLEVFVDDEPDEHIAARLA